MRETLYGRHAVRECLRARRRVPFRLVMMDSVLSSPVLDEIIELAEQRGIPIEHPSHHLLSSLVGGDNHQGVALETSGYPYGSIYDMLDLAEARGETPLLLLLDLVQDVHNLGSLIRSAEAAGVHGVVIQKRRAAGVTPAAVNVSSGAVEHLLIAQVTNISRAIGQLKDEHIWIVGLEDVYGAQPYTESDLTVPLGLVVGSEGNGLRRLVRDNCDWLISLPLHGQINSLNAAVAGSIALYEALRQRRKE
ncbi:MAG: 23S rRNA (guanosine(2251)-2'-O)-methyltransferase RlmB [Chloroflexota bacterium]|nr:23S rRNA (guanosine(2251)-2'-O)-methyltransferase RlmB [Chloroflexota bacterium]